jgi:hypothetical protein
MYPYWARYSAAFRKSASPPALSAVASSSAVSWKSGAVEKSPKGETSTRFEKLERRGKKTGENKNKKLKGS